MSQNLDMNSNEEDEGMEVPEHIRQNLERPPERQGSRRGTRSRDSNPGEPSNMRSELRKAAEARARRANKELDEEIGGQESNIADNETMQESTWTEVTEPPASERREFSSENLVDSIEA